jgi:trimethylamine---corrinoid protein Co-methyltransferase
MAAADPVRPVLRPSLTFTVLSEADLDDVHAATLEVLEHTGVFVEDDEALGIFAAGGCRADRETRVVRIPPHVVEEALKSCPRSVRLCGRDPARDVVLEAGRVSFSNFDEGIMLVDPRTGRYRHPGIGDVGEVARLVDALDCIDAYESAVGAEDVPAASASVRKWVAAIRETTKPVGSEATSAVDVRAVVAAAQVVAGGEDELRRRPLCGFGVCPVSPLQLPRDATEVVVEAARSGMSDTIVSMALAGGTSPVTLAGTLVTHNAEVLSALVLAQLTERGAEVIYGSSTTGMDLRLATAAVGSPELGIISAAVAQLARRYDLPSFVAGL